MKQWQVGLIGVVILMLSWTVFAAQQPRPLSTDSRMRVVAYDPDNVVTIIGSQLVETTIEFGEDETILSVGGGDSAAWTIDPVKNKPNVLGIKPTVDASNTDIVVYTDKNSYHFNLVLSPKESASDKNVTYNIRFIYPQKERDALAQRLKAQQQLKNSLVMDNSVDPLTVNWDYSFSRRCAKDFVPIKAFDNGKFTYFQFSPNVEVPAIFVVDGQGKESLANWQQQGQYIVIQRLARQFSMRNGKVVSCVFNDNYPST